MSKNPARFAPSAVSQDHSINRPVPVMQLIDGFATEEQSGGAAQFGIQLARHLDRSRYQPFVCGLWAYSTPSERRWREQLHHEGIGTAILVERPGRLGPDLLRAAALLQRLVNRVRPQVINSHFERGDLLGLWSKLAHPSHPRIVRTMHADQQWQTRPWLGALLNLAAFPWLFDGEVAISAATRQVMDRRAAARLLRRRATLLYNGVSGALVERLARRSADRPPGRAGPPRLAIIGRLEPQKGHAFLLRALPAVLEREPAAELLVVGAGSLRAELEALAAELGIAPAVRFLGQRPDVAELLLEVDLLVSASIWEGLPTVILEAMAARVPVVATDVSGSRELVRGGETGVLVPMRDVAALERAICWMLDHPAEAAGMAARAQQEVGRFTLEHTAEGYHQLYQSILQSPIRAGYSNGLFKSSSNQNR